MDILYMSKNVIMCDSVLANYRCVRNCHSVY